MTAQSITVFSIREHHDKAEQILAYVKQHWASEASAAVYDDCFYHCLQTTAPLPQWYGLYDGDHLIGCAGLITNDFISRMDLYPWLCALYIDPSYRNQGLGGHLVHVIVEDARKWGFETVYLCTDHIGYYEKLGFAYIGDGYHPWNEKSRIYQIKT